MIFLFLKRATIETPLTPEEAILRLMDNVEPEREIRLNIFDDWKEFTGSVRGSKFEIRRLGNSLMLRRRGSIFSPGISGRFIQSQNPNDATRVFIDITASPLTAIIFWSFGAIAMLVIFVQYFTRDKPSLMQFFGPVGILLIASIFSPYYIAQRLWTTGIL